MEFFYIMLSLKRRPAQHNERTIRIPLRTRFYVDFEQRMHLLSRTTKWRRAQGQPKNWLAQ
jgi:hypothetical protein